MIFQLRKIANLDFYILNVKGASLLGELLSEGTFDEVFAYAQNLASSFIDFAIVYDDKINTTNISEDACYVIDLNNLYNMSDIAEIEQKGVIYIVITSSDLKTSLPSHRFAFKASLSEIFQRLYIYIKRVTNGTND